MKLLNILVFLLLSNLSLKAQAYILYQGNNQAIYIEDLTTKSWKIISSNAFGNLAGYEIKGNTLFYYLEVHGELTKYEWTDVLLKNIISYPVLLEPNIETSHLTTQQFRFGEYTFIRHCTNHLRMCKGETVIWDNLGDTTKLVSDYTILPWLAGYIHPQISPDGKTILIEAKDTRMFVSRGSTLYEIDVYSGIMKKIRKGYDATYSTDGRYILFCDNKYSYLKILDRDTNEIIDWNGNRAFWLFRK